MLFLETEIVYFLPLAPLDLGFQDYQWYPGEKKNTQKTKQQTKKSQKKRNYVFKSKWLAELHCQN